MPGLLLLAGAVVAASPLTPMPWFEFHDYPTKAFEKKAEGVTRFDLLVSPEGKIADCKVTVSSGNEDLDKRTCFLAGRRARFAPATDESGRPVFGVVRSQAVWKIPVDTLEGVVRTPETQLSNLAPGPDLEVNLNRLPEGTTEPAVVKLAYSVDTRGNPTSCSLMRLAQHQPKMLVDLGCRELLQRLPHTPVLDPSGQAVPAVKTAAVKFNAGR